MMSDNSGKSENFTALAARLGLTPAEMLVITHKIGLGIFDPNYGSFELSSEHVAKVEQYVAEHEFDDENQTSNKKSKKKTRRQQNNAVKAKKSKTEEIDPRSVLEFAEYFSLSEDDIRQMCDENDITISDAKQHMSKVDRRKLATLLFNKKLNGSTSNTTETLIPVVETKRIDAPAASNTAIERAVHKRISVIARELNTDDETLRYVIDALQIRIIHDRFEKVEVRHETDIKRALSAKAHLPDELTDRGEMKLKAIASRFGVPHARLVEFCAEQGIPIRHTRYVSPHGGLRIATLLDSQHVIQELNKIDVSPTPLVPQPEKLDDPLQDAPTVNYQGISLVRQNFKNFSFEKSDMRQVDLSFSILVEANLSGVDATSGEFSRVQAALADFSNANLSHAKFDHADLLRSSLRHACCNGTNFSNANLQRVDFTGANLTGADVRWADLSNAIFSNTTWTNGKVINDSSEAVIEN